MKSNQLANFVQEILKQNLSTIKESSSTFGVVPSPEVLQQMLDEKGGWSMELKGQDARSFKKAMGVELQMTVDEAERLMHSGEGLHKVLEALVNFGGEWHDENAESLASSILSVLGHTWV